jgi:hypothetical protein
MREKIAFRVALLSLLLAIAVNPSVASAASPNATPQPPPDLAGCWTLTVDRTFVTDQKPNTFQQLLPLSTANPIPPDKIRFTKDSVGNGYSAIVLDPNREFAHHWHAQVFKGATDPATGSTIYYVPMSSFGETQRNYSVTADATLGTYSGIADTDKRITGTWVDMRGRMSVQDLICTDQTSHTDPSCTQDPKGTFAAAASNHSIIMGTQTGRYTLVKGCK